MRTKPDWSSTQNLTFDKREEKTARRDGELKDRTKDGVQDQTWLGIRRHRNGTATGDCATDSFSKTAGETAGDGVTVVIELVRKVWIAEECDIARGRGDQEDECASCPICLEPMFSGRAVVTSCSHCFHIGCCRQSERVSIGTAGFWVCPSCREPITSIHALMVKCGQVSAEMDTAPITDNSPNLTYVLKRNPAMQSVIRNLLLLEDYVVGSRSKGQSGETVGLQAASIES